MSHLYLFKNKSLVGALKESKHIRKVGFSFFFFLLQKNKIKKAYTKENALPNRIMKFHYCTAYSV